MLTNEERELLIELLSFNRDCQDSQHADGAIDKATYMNNVALIESIKSKL